MKAIVFSKDRAMQLDLLLTSLERNAPGVFEPTVLWFSRKEAFQEAYATCAAEHPDVEFLLEDGLTYQVRSLLRDPGWVAFFTDDDVLYRPLRPFFLGLDTIAFSLRLGQNTNWCYPHAREQKVPDLTDLRWRWKDADGDFGYPMSLDGHIFWREDVLSIVEDRHFGTPNLLEVMLMKQAHTLDKPFMACHVESSLVGVPANRVQSAMPNRHGETYPYSVQELNDLYLAGERVDLDALDFSDIRGAHQEIPLVFR